LESINLAERGTRAGFSNSVRQPYQIFPASRGFLAALTTPGLLRAGARSNANIELTKDIYMISMKKKPARAELLINILERFAFAA
jgi:uncharacterized protein YrrD